MARGHTYNAVVEKLGIINIICWGRVPLRGIHFVIILNDNLWLFVLTSGFDKYSAGLNDSVERAAGRALNISRKS